ncbi:MAG TPA: hypothetical protein VG502_19830 [Flexivirga sp.]|uniref:hypothetical protein n=1 Tax=Flexivirga sp. TaxID=1962927 RepID=UPI002CEC62E0|nr:hypothetical protein [Flexivirga sp.]HWC24551.1 hypothetical protein [Flexivirga sp.]
MTEHEHDVPPRPAFVLRVRNDANGAPTAWLDDQQITVPPGVGIHRALIREARRRADRTQPGRTIRVAGMTPDGATFHLGIGPDGDAWEVPAPDSADAGATAAPASAPAPEQAAGAVPDDVSHVIELQDRDERLIGLVDDEEIPLVAGGDPYDQLLREARRRADEHAPGETVRVLGRTPGARVWHIALTPDGTPQVIAPVQGRPEAPTGRAQQNGRAQPADGAGPADRAQPAAPVNAFRPAAAPTRAEEPRPQPAYAPEDEATESPAPPTAALTDDHGRPIPTTTAPASTPQGFSSGFGSSTPPSDDPDDELEADHYEPAPETRKDGPSRRALFLGGAGAVALVAAGTAGFFAFRSGDDSTNQPTPTTSGTPLPDSITPPAGLPASYLWSVVKLSDVAPRLVMTDKQLVVTVDNDTTGGTELVSLDPDSGKSQWKTDLPVDAVVADGPALVPIDGSDAIVLTTQTQIIAYPLSGGDPKTWPLEPKWSVALTDSGVIVSKPDDTGHAFVLHGDKLSSRALPKGANPVAVLADGTLVATDAHGKVWLSADATTAPKPKQLKAPRGTTPGTFVAATRDQIITAFVPKDDPQASRLRAFSLPTLKPRMTTAPVKPAVFPTTFMLAPDESWAVAGNAWVDMTTGDSHVITARWSPIAISQHNSWSKSGDNVLTATSRGKSLGAAKGSNGQVAVPKGGTAKVVYCVASIGSDTTLYAVPLKG